MPMSELALQYAVLDDPAQAVAIARMTLTSARDRSCAFLCTYALAGDVLALGRYHVAPPTAGDVRLLRRSTGGRPAPLGEGFVAMALALPHGRDLVRNDPTSVTPERLLNRAVRGLLGALESLGIAAYYPGRDVVTVDGRTIAGLGIDVAHDGSVLVEAAVALGRSFATVTGFVDRADPSGVVPMDLMSDAQGTSVAETIARVPDLEAWTAALATGYARRLGFDVTMEGRMEPPPPDASWIAAGRLAPHLVRHAVTRDVLGVVEVYAASDGRLVDDVRVCGDVMAPSPVVERLEATLRGAPVDRDELRRRAAAGAAEGLLGVRSLATIGDLVYEACRQ